jgi:hypothetical protein
LRASYPENLRQSHRFTAIDSSSIENIFAKTRFEFGENVPNSPMKEKKTYYLSKAQINTRREAISPRSFSPIHSPISVEIFKVKELMSSLSKNAASSEEESPVNHDFDDDDKNKGELEI